jgi:hypothetical protein
MPKSSDHERARQRQKSFEPLAVTFDQAELQTGESKGQLKRLVRRGELKAVKSGRRTLIIYQSIKDRLASLPAATYAAPAKGKSAATPQPRKHGRLVKREAVEDRVAATDEAHKPARPQKHAAASPEFEVSA